MKKLVLLLIMLALILCTFTGCQSADAIEDGYTRFQLEKDETFWDYHEGWAYTVSAEGYLSNGSCIVVNKNTVYRMRPDGSDKQKIFNEDNASFAYGFFHGNRIYYFAFPVIDGVNYEKEMTLYSMRLDGSEKIEIVSNVDYVVPYGDWLYYYLSEWTTANNLYRIKTDGSNNQLVIEDCGGWYLVEAGYIFLVDSYYYAASDFASRIIRYNLDGSGEKILVEYDKAALEFGFTDKNYLYYKIRYGNGYREGDQLDRIKFNGSDCQTVIEHEEYSLFELSLDNGFVYYARRPSRVTAGAVQKQEVYKIRADGIDCVKIHETEYYSVCIFKVVGGNVFYDTLHMSESNSDIYLHRLTSNGENSIVYEKDNGEYYHGFFVCKNKLYVIVSENS